MRKISRCKRWKHDLSQSKLERHSHHCRHWFLFSSSGPGVYFDVHMKHTSRHLIKLWFGQIKLLLKLRWRRLPVTENSPIDIYKLLPHWQRPRMKIQDGGLYTTKMNRKKTVETFSKWKKSIFEKKSTAFPSVSGLTKLQRQPLRACNYPRAGLYKGCCYSCFIIRSTDGLLSGLVFPALCLRTLHKSSWWGWSALKNSAGPSVIPSFSFLVTLYKRPLCLGRFLP